MDELVRAQILSLSRAAHGLTERSGTLSEDDLKRNLFSILTISDQLLPGHGLKAVAEELHAS